MDIKIVFILGILLSVVKPVCAQEPVQWDYTVKNLSADTYEVRISATIQDGWHLYAEKQPEDAIALPTKIEFTKSPILELKGVIKEEGQLDRFVDPNLGIAANQYLHKVDFIQVIKLKMKAQLKISGTIQFQVCNEQECLPPEITHFSIPIKE